MKCSNCEKFAHYASEYRAPSKNRVEEKTNYVEEKSKEGDTLLMTSTGNERSEGNRWYLNTGASNHIYEKRSIFMELDESESQCSIRR